MKRIILVTGTPGTGKSTLAKELAKKLNYELIDIGKIESAEFIEGKEENEKIINVTKMCKFIKEREKESENGLVVDSHLSHYCNNKDVLVCFVLRCEPSELGKRLSERGYNKTKIKENLEAEAMDLILQEALQNKQPVHEIDTTRQSDDKTLKEALEVIAGKRKKEYGKVDYTGYL